MTRALSVFPVTLKTFWYMTFRCMGFVPLHSLWCCYFLSVVMRCWACYLSFVCFCVCLCGLGPRSKCPALCTLLDLWPRKFCLKDTRPEDVPWLINNQFPATLEAASNAACYFLTSASHSSRERTAAQSLTLSMPQNLCCCWCNFSPASERSPAWDNSYIAEPEAFILRTLPFK